MPFNEFKKTITWHKRFKSLGYEPDQIFENSNSLFSILFSLSFFLMIMSSEILLNQPIKKKIKIIHENFLFKLFSKDNKKIERIETNSFAFSLFMIMQKLFKEDDSLEKYSEKLIIYSTAHWSAINKLSEKNYLDQLKTILQLWQNNKKIVFSKIEESKIDLIILLYKSFEVRIPDKDIIKKNIAVLGFSISKVFKEFRYDVLREFKKKEKIIK